MYGGLKYAGSLGYGKDTYTRSFIDCVANPLYITSEHCVPRSLSGGLINCELVELDNGFHASSF